MANITEANGAIDLESECRKWQNCCAELTAERDRLRDELAESQADRDAYLRALYAYLRNEHPVPTFSKAEVLAAVAHEPPLSALIAELKKEYALES